MIYSYIYGEINHEPWREGETVFWPEYEDYLILGKMGADRGYDVDVAAFVADTDILAMMEE